MKNQFLRIDTQQEKLFVTILTKLANALETERTESAYWACRDFTSNLPPSPIYKYRAPLEKLRSRVHNLERDIERELLANQKALAVKEVAQ